MVSVLQEDKTVIKLNKMVVHVENRFIKITKKIVEKD